MDPLIIISIVLVVVMVAVILYMFLFKDKLKILEKSIANLGYERVCKPGEAEKSWKPAYDRIQKNLPLYRQTLEKITDEKKRNEFLQKYPFTSRYNPKMDCGSAFCPGESTNTNAWDPKKGCSCKKDFTFSRISDEGVYTCKPTAS